MYQKPDPVIFWHNFIKTTSVSVILGILDTENLFLVLHKINALYKLCVHSSVLAATITTTTADS